MREVLEPGDGWIARHMETICDEDRLDAYKLMALRVTLEG